MPHRVPRPTRDVPPETTSTGTPPAITRLTVAWVPVLGLSAVVGSCLLRTYHTSTTTQQHNPYSNSVFDINPISPTLHSNFSFHPTHPTIRIISRILGDLSVPERA
eukprot:COSAG01_NODE_1967_length_8771_cov_35.479659_2_plen_106_part_00